MKGEGRSVAFLADDIDRGVMLFQDFMDNGETKPGTFGFGGEKGVEYFAEVACGDACAMIGALQRHLAGTRTRPMLKPSRKVYTAASGHGFDGIEQQVDQHLLNLVGVADNIGQVI